MQEIRLNPKKYNIGKNIFSLKIQVGFNFANFYSEDFSDSVYRKRTILATVE